MIKEKLKNSLDWIVDTCYSNPHAVGGALTGIATTLFCRQIGMPVFESYWSGTMGFIAGSMATSAVITSIKKDKFRNIQSKEERENNLKEKIEEFENSEKGKSRPLLVKAKDTALKHPKTIAALMTIGIFHNDIPYEFLNFPWQVYDALPKDQGFTETISSLKDMYSSGKLDMMLGYYYARIVPLEISIFALGYTASNLSRNLFHSAFYEKTKVIAAGMLAESRHDYDKAIEEYEKSDSEGGMHGRIAKLHMKKDNMDHAFNNLSKAAIKNMNIGPTDSLLRMRYISKGLMAKRKIKREPKNLKNWLVQAYNHHELFNKEESIEVIEDAEKRFPSEARVKFLHAEILESIDRPEEAKQKYLEAGMILLQSDDFEENFSLIGDFRNEVLIHKFDQYIKNLIAIKRNKDSTRLNVEKEQIMALKPIFGDTISDFLCDFKSNDYHHIFLRYIAGKNLLQLRNDKDYDRSMAFYNLTESIDLLKRIEKEGMEAYRNKKINLRDVLLRSGDYFLARAGTAVGCLRESGIEFSDHESAEILKGLYHSGLPLFMLPRRYYTDSNLMNFMKNGKIRKIDFENDELFPSVYFYVNMLEFGSETLSENEKWLLKHQYWGDDIDMFEKFQPFGAAQRHMEMIGYRSRDIINKREEDKLYEWDHNARRFHAIKLIHHAGIITEDAGKYEDLIGKEGIKNIERMLTVFSSVSARL
ncbi:tetratricopeptide repeat protein [candidate division KSB1 bacterium]